MKRWLEVTVCYAYSSCYMEPLCMFVYSFLIFNLMSEINVKKKYNIFFLRKKLIRIGKKEARRT